MRMRSVGVGLGLVVVAVGVALGAIAYRASEARRFREDLDRAKQDVLDGRHASALRQLRALAERRPAEGEVHYLIGLCESNRGRADAAEAAWSRVAADAPHFGWVAMHWAQLDEQRGQFARAEDRLRDALAVAGAHRPWARWPLVQLLRLEGRFAEARRLFEDGFAEHPEPIEALKVLYKLDVDAFPIESARQSFAMAARLAPEDDRVWLGRAHLAIRSGQLDEAQRWLDACRRRRPDDPAVWRMTLEWAREADRPEVVRQALFHLPVIDDTEGAIQALELRAWFATRQGDRDAERRALEQWHDLDPGNAEVLERLAALALESGQVARATALRTRRAELERLRDRYPRLLSTEDPGAHAQELAEIASALGRRLDAAYWSRVADSPESIGEGHSILTATATSSTRTLADLLPDLVEAPEASDLRRAGVAEPSGPRPWFEDHAEAAGLRFVHDNGDTSRRLTPPVTSSGGVALLDYDRDGWMDVYVVQGGPFPPDPNRPHDGDKLFRNNGDGTFRDVTAEAGLAAFAHGYGHGVTVADYDNDGYPDLFVTRWRSYALYRNNGDGTFSDVTEAVGLDGDRDWPTSAAFADFDNDGRLDLYVCHYLVWDEDDLRSCTDPNDPTIYHCNPRNFRALPDRLFRNDGGRFVEVTAEAGIVDPDGRGLGVVAAHLDDDDWIDLFVANDMTADYLFRNLGGFRFEEQGLSAGVAGNASGGYQAGMGVAAADLDGDGRIDLAVTNFYNEGTTFFRNLGDGLFADHSAAIGLTAPSRFLLGFGVAFLDVNNDGHLDLMTANGHVHDGRPRYPWTMPAQLLLGGPHGRLTDVTTQAGPPFQGLHLGRGLAAGDLDNDGRIDALLVSQNQPLVFFHNQTNDPGHFVTLLLEGTASNRDAVGARVTLEAGGRRQHAQRVGGGSYQSANDPRLHFGLGASDQVDWVEVRWPSGSVDRYEGLAADTGHHLREGDPTARPLAGWSRVPTDTTNTQTDQGPWELRTE